MKVKVSYTVNMDDIPELLEEILSSARQELSDCVSKLKFRPNNLLKMMNDYQIVREKLDVVTSQVEDVLNIASGWTEAIKPPPTPEVVDELFEEVTVNEKKD